MSSVEELAHEWHGRAGEARADPSWRQVSRELHKAIKRDKIFESERTMEVPDDSPDPVLRLAKIMVKHRYRNAPNAGLGVGQPDIDNARAVIAAGWVAPEQNDNRKEVEALIEAKAARDSVPSELGVAISKAAEYLALVRKAEKERREWMEIAMKFSDYYYDERNRRVDVEAELSVAKGNSLYEWRREYRRGHDDALRNVAKRIENHRTATHREDGYNGGLQYAREIAKNMLNEVYSDTDHGDRGNPL